MSLEAISIRADRGKKTGSMATLILREGPWMELVRAREVGTRDGYLLDGDGARAFSVLLVGCILSTVLVFRRGLPLV